MAATPPGHAHADVAARSPPSSHGITFSTPPPESSQRPHISKHLSAPAYQSPVRQHKRTPSTPRHVKEDLNARSEYTNSEDDGQAQHRINQYIIKEEIGRGSFGAVHLAVDQYGNEFAVKEFSKARLRKRAQSHILRRPHGRQRRPGHLAVAAGHGLNSPLHRHSASDIHDQELERNPLYLIQEEIAIMKKLNHVNLVSLIEVLDDPREDSLYMVLEMCEKGVVMKIGIDEKAEPYESEKCRHWFRDLILGIEYLHAQGIVHRDIKPDNLLLTGDDVLKIVDFGVSEMFEKESKMYTAKSAGSPAFLPPELCIPKHGDVSGKAADIWSMGVTLYCLRFGRVPFEDTNVLALYDAIRLHQIPSHANVEPEFQDLLSRILEKDPEKRITMDQLRTHPWVTRNGQDPLLSAEENTAELIEPPTEEEVNRAITNNFRQLLTVMRAVRRFRALTAKRPPMMGSILSSESRLVQPPLQISPPQSHSEVRKILNKAKSLDVYSKSAAQQTLVIDGVEGETLRFVPEHSDHQTMASMTPISVPRHNAEVMRESHNPTRNIKASGAVSSPAKHHSHYQSKEGSMILDVGPGGGDFIEGTSHNIISESPPAADFNIYETAYQAEVKRIREEHGEPTKIYLTKRIERIKDMIAGKMVRDGDHDGGRPKISWTKVLEKAKEQAHPSHESPSLDL